jgi:hypothetical protein
MFGLPKESMMATVTPWPWLPAAYSGPRLYEACIEVGVKQRRWAAMAEAQSAWVGGMIKKIRKRFPAVIERDQTRYQVFWQGEAVATVPRTGATHRRVARGSLTPGLPQNGA